MKSDTVFQEKYDDLKLQMAMYLLRQKELEETEKEIENLASHPEYQPNPYEEKMIMETIDRTLQRQKWKYTWKMASRIIQKVSVFLVILLLGIGTTVITVEAIRVPFINWLISLQEDSTSIHFNKEQDLENLTFGYLPDGYNATFVSSNSNTTYYSIENSFGDTLILSICSLDAGYNVDTEQAQFSEVKVNGKKATTIQKGDSNTLVWSIDSSSLLLEGTLALDELIKIAENISF